MSTPAQDFWNGVPEEILAHIFSYLPFEDRHMAFKVCQRWAKAISVHYVWKFTEISTEDMSEPCMQKQLQPFLFHMKHLKIVLDPYLGVCPRNFTQILNMLTWQSHEVQALCIVVVCCGEGLFFSSCPDILQSFRRLCDNPHKIDLQYLDLRETPFTLDNRLVRLIATSSPNLHTLLIHNHPVRIITLRPETIAEVLRVCPKLSALGVYYAMLSEEVFRELLKPSRGPSRFLDIFCEDMHHYIPERLWFALTERHSQLRVGLEFAPLVPVWRTYRILTPSIPVTDLQFSCRTYMVPQLRFVLQQDFGEAGLFF
ncbi:F-box/LRR-repeat protein 8-like [Hemicordylus capensis]|uniref:F-box/LRR-repeat protein 8-like n=1 Tax=Hemicordylus capensis TaxID=884348 RepID=UPI002303C182|nr:F-box/LRR-repeat protein 8-like [Hemicordylus capensis]